MVKRQRDQGPPIFEHVDKCSGAGFGREFGSGRFGAETAGKIGAFGNEPEPGEELQDRSRPDQSELVENGGRCVEGLAIPGRVEATRVSEPEQQPRVGPDALEWRGSAKKYLSGPESDYQRCAAGEDSRNSTG